MTNTLALQAAPGPTAEFLKKCESLLMEALEAVAAVLRNEAAPPASRLRAAFGVIDLVYGRSGAQPRTSDVAKAQAVLAALPAQPPRKESLEERFRRERREKAEAAKAAAAGS